MRIAIIGYFDIPSWKEGLVNGAKRLRHKVVTIGPYDTNPNSFCMVNGFKFDIPLENKYTWKWDELSLICKMEGYELKDFDLVLVLETNMDIYGERPDEIKDIPVIYIVTDSHRGCDAHIKNFYQMHADYLAYSKLYFKRIYEDTIGEDKVFWLPECTDPEIFKPIRGVEEEYEIIWLGYSGMKPDGTVEDPVFGENAWRATYIKYLEKESEKGEFTFKHYGFIRKREDYIKALNTGKIILNVGGGISPLQAQTSNRIFEGMAVEKLVLTSYFVDLPLMFEDGKEIISFKSYHHYRHPYTIMFDCEEMKRLIKYYIEHEDERKEIGKNARRCITKKYSGEKNVKRIIDFLEKKKCITKSISVKNWKG